MTQEAPKVGPEPGGRNAARPSREQPTDAAAISDVQVTVAMEGYLTHLAHLDLPLSQKIAMIEALCTIMQSFVDRAFGDDPVQRAIEVADKSKNSDDRSERAMVYSEDTINNQTKDLASTFRSKAKGKPGGKR